MDEIVVDSSGKPIYRKIIYEREGSGNVYTVLEELLEDLNIPKWHRIHINWNLEKYDLAATQTGNESLNIYKLPNGQYYYTLTEVTFYSLSGLETK